MKILAALFLSSVAFAQNNDWQFKGATLIQGRAFEIYQDQEQNQIYKPRTPPTPPSEDEPSPANEFGRQTPFNNYFGFGWQQLDKDGTATDPKGAVTLDLGASVRIPVKFLQRLETGANLNIFLANCNSEDSTEEMKSWCPKNFVEYISRNWTAYSAFDLFIFKNSYKSYSLSAGPYIQRTGLDRMIGETRLGVEHSLDKGAMIRFTAFGDDYQNPQGVSSHVFEFTVQVNQRGFWRFAMGANMPLGKSRVNPPIRVEK